MSNLSSMQILPETLIDYEGLPGLVQRIAAQDKSAFRTFYHLTAAKLLGIIFCIVRDQDLAEDILQETYLKVWHRAADYRLDLGVPMAWVTAMARNRALDEVRKRTHLMAPNGILEIEDIPEPLLRPLMEGRAAATDNIVMSCLDRLEQSNMEMIVLAYTFGLARDKLAERFNIPVGTVKTWLRRALTDLRACMVSDNV